MNATILDVSVDCWGTCAEPCEHDTFEAWETYDAQGGAINMQCSTCGEHFTITPIDGKTITMTLKGAADGL